MTNEQKQVADEVEGLPTIFGLRAFPGKQFYINIRSSYVSSTTGKVQIVVAELFGSDFTRCTKSELLREMVK